MSDTRRSPPVDPNNDDPTLSNAHASSGAALAVVERSTTTITSAMLRIADADRNPADLSTTTPVEQLVYTVGTRPTDLACAHRLL